MIEHIMRPSHMNVTTNSTLAILQQIQDEAPISLYGGMTPNFRFNTCMIVMWGLLLATQVFQVIYRQPWFSTAFICTGILEVLGYIGRTWSHKDTTLMDPFLLNMICLTIAPVFTMGGMYYQMAKLIEIYGHNFSIIKSPMLYSYIFISSDIVSLAIQAAGGGTAGVAVNRNKSAHTGDNIFVAGLAIQVASMAVFLTLWFYFLHGVFIRTRLQHMNLSTKKLYAKGMWSISQRDIDHMYTPKYHKLRLEPERWQFHYFTLGMTIAVLTIFTRCVYRLCELAEGWDGYLITHEWYFIILDALMMLLATLAMTIFHPGYAFLGKTTSIPIGDDNKNSNKKSTGKSSKWAFWKKNNTNSDSIDMDNVDLESADFESNSENKDEELHKEDRHDGVPNVEDQSTSNPSKKSSWKFW